MTVVDDYSVTWREVKPLLEEELARQNIGEDDKIAMGVIDESLTKVWQDLFEKMNKEPDQKQEVIEADNENIMRPVFGASFHGECWFRCPKCEAAFEYWDAVFERRGFKHVRDKLYKHECGQVIDMT